MKKITKIQDSELSPEQKEKIRKTKEIWGDEGVMLNIDVVFDKQTGLTSFKAKGDATAMVVSCNFIDEPHVSLKEIYRVSTPYANLLEHTITTVRVVDDN